MKVFFILSALVASTFVQAQHSPITSRIDTVDDEYITLIQEFTVKTSVENVWKAYTTGEGWQAWVAPLADVNLKPGGKIRTNYNKDGELGDSTTNYLTIVNYYEGYFITIQADVKDEWPQFLKDDAPNMYNVITFDPIDKSSTKVVSYGMGYRQTPEHANVLGYFVKANEGLLRKMIQCLER